MSKIMLAMSGGVDSSVAAYQMQKAGYTCVGATMLLCDKALLGGVEPADNARDAEAVAKRLGMPFHILDNTADFRQKVVEPFIVCYEAGGTPNPCVYCNKQIKFGDLLQQALDLGCDGIATGHYARIEEKDGRYLLFKAKDLSKDQSYFLACLNQQQLSHSYFPLGDLTKDQVRQIAGEQGFVTAKKQDSQDICFIPDGDYKAFMEQYTQKTYPGGDYLDLNGKVIGQHQGAVGYTIGQRKGLGIALGAPAYVCQKDMAHNTVTLGPDAALYRKDLLADNWNFIPFDTLDAPMRMKARVRYRHVEQPATVYPMENGIVRVEFDQPQRAITPGQNVVLYQDDLVIGCGTIL